MKKIMCLISALVFIMVWTLACPVEANASDAYWDLEDSIAYVDEEGNLWFKEFNTSYYFGDSIKWYVDGTNLIVEGSFAGTYYYDEYETDDYFRIRMCDDADDYSDGIDWLIYSYYKYQGTTPYGVYAKLDMSKYGDGIYELLYDVDCCAYEVCYMLIKDGEIYVQPWDRDYRYQDVEKYNELMCELEKVDTSYVVENFKNSIYAECYDYYSDLDLDVCQKAIDITTGVRSDYYKARTIYDYVAGCTWVRGVEESNQLYGAMLNYIGIPTVYINGDCIWKCTPMVASYIDGRWIINTVPAPHTNSGMYVNVIACGFDLTPLAIMDRMKIETVDLTVDDFIYVEVNDDSVSESVIVKEYPEIKVKYNTHIQSYGWECGDYYYDNCYSCCSSDGDVSGTVGKGKRLEAIKIDVESSDVSNCVDLGVRYTTHCQSYGWLPWSSDGDMSGTEGEGKRLEAIMIELTGADADKYDIYYRVHAQSYGWLAWAKNGAPSGTAGYGKRLEAIQIVVVKKGTSVPATYMGITPDCEYEYVASIGNSLWPEVLGKETPNVTYRTHVQTYGWQGWKYNGQMSGTSGQAKRLEGIEIEITNQDCYGDIVYTTHVQSYGWQDDLNDKSTWSSDGEMSGTWGEAKRLEAICIALTGEMAEKYDVYYRVHAQTYGWLGWAKNGEAAGTAGYSKRLEGIQIVLVPKGADAPENSYGGITSVISQAYVEK